LIASLACARAGHVNVVQNGQGKNPVVIKHDAFSLAPVPSMGEGKPNQAFLMQLLSRCPGQRYKSHASMSSLEARWPHMKEHNNSFSNVIRGSGQLTLVGAKEESVQEISYKSDDIIVFEPHTLHGWVNGDEPFDFLGVDLPVLRK
jgi:hypothetical protein